jgi:hypothetical protein
VRDLRGARDAGADDAVALVAETSDLSEAQVRLASAYYAAYPDEIDERIAAEEALTERLLAGAA